MTLAENVEKYNFPEKNKPRRPTFVDFLMNYSLNQAYVMNIYNIAQLIRKNKK